MCTITYIQKNTAKLEVLDDYKVVISLVFINYFYKGNLSHILWKSQHRLRLGFNVALDGKNKINGHWQTRLRGFFFFPFSRHKVIGCPIITIIYYRLPVHF